MQNIYHFTSPRVARILSDKGHLPLHHLNPAINQHYLSIIRVHPTRHPLPPERPVPAQALLVGGKVVALENLLAPAAEHLQRLHLLYLRGGEDSEEIVFAILVGGESIGQVNAQGFIHIDKQLIRAGTAAAVLHCQAVEGAFQRAGDGGPSWILDFGGRRARRPRSQGGILVYFGVDE